MDGDAAFWSGEPDLSPFRTENATSVSPVSRIEKSVPERTFSSFEGLLERKLYEWSPALPADRGAQERVGTVDSFPTQFLTVPCMTRLRAVGLLWLVLCPMLAALPARAEVQRSTLVLSVDGGSRDDIETAKAVLTSTPVVEAAGVAVFEERPYSTVPK